MNETSFDIASKMQSNLMFPAEQCCNCSMSQGIEIIDQDTRVTTYLFGGGSEITFQLPLPFCKGCKKTATRRPKSIFHRLLLFLIFFGVAALACIIAGDLVLKSTFIADYLITISITTAFLISAVLYALQRPRGKQSSYFQPIRITKLKREFLSGNITAITLTATSKNYKRELIRENSEGIQMDEITIK